MLARQYPCQESLLRCLSRTLAELSGDCSRTALSSETGARHAPDTRGTTLSGGAHPIARRGQLTLLALAGNYPRGPPLFAAVPASAAVLVSSVSLGLSRFQV